MKAFRFFHRKPVKDGTDWGMWQCNLGMTSLMPESSAKRLVAEWNARDNLSREWRYEECLPTDIDYPKESVTKVIFRMDISKGGDVVAIFPEEASTCGKPEYCGCYVHVGQHGSADPFWVFQKTRPATEVEYAPLKKELEQIGYKLRIMKRFSKNAYQIRRKQLER